MLAYKSCCLLQTLLLFHDTHLVSKRDAHQLNHLVPGETNIRNALNHGFDNLSFGQTDIECAIEMDLQLVGGITLDEQRGHSNHFPLL